VRIVKMLDPIQTMTGDPARLQQVLWNLLANAIKFTPSGGSITLEARAEGQPDGDLVLAVSDTGVGMSDEVKAHLFEPFFTTKAAGQGTGLGLSTVYGIVKQSEGYVWVYSEVGQGARFKVFLPRVEAAAQPVSAADASTVPGGSETILLVEDDEAMRMLTRNCLESGGYTVLDAHEGEAAIHAVSQHSGSIHLLLTDVVMPGLSGRSLAESLVVARPEIKILYMSGYTADIITQRGILEPEVALLEKPFTKEALLRKVRKVLDGERFVHAAAAGQS